MRTFKGVRAKMAMDFSMYSGGHKPFRILVEEGMASEEALLPFAQRVYTARDIRTARLKIGGFSTDYERDPSTLPPIINCRMSKGGTGKTTVATNIGATLSLMGHRVLVIDADPQASLTTLFGIDWTKDDITHIGELMHRVARGKPCDVQGAIRSIYPDGMLDLIASDITLVNADSWLMTASNREGSFKRMLDANIAVFGKYDVIVVDSAPGITALSNAVMFACKTVLAVVMLDGQSIRAMDVLASNIDELNSAFADRNLNLGVHIVANGYHPSYQTCKEALELIARTYGPLLDDNIIPHAAGFMRQMSMRDEQDSGPIIEREPQCLGAQAMIRLCHSLIGRYGIKLLPPGPAATAATDLHPAASTTGKVKKARAVEAAL